MAAGDGQCLALAGSERAEGQEVNAKGATPEVVREVRELFVELRVPLCRYLISLGLSANEAEDAAQESFVRLCERHQTPENVRGWVFRVAHNLARDEQRRRKRRPEEELRFDENTPPYRQKQAIRMGHDEPGDARSTPEEHLLEREQDARLKAALARLPESQRHCLHLRAEGLKYREIAEVLQVGISTVAEWVQKGLKSLERDLA
jgi:RNA polymerase sigma-70 factor (ECF subfamily)